MKKKVDQPSLKSVAAINGSVQQLFTLNEMKNNNSSLTHRL